MRTITFLVAMVALISTGASSQIVSATTGNWNAPATWTGGVVPSTTDAVVIANGHTVTINSNVVIGSLTVGQGTSGSLRFLASASDTMTISGNLTVAAGGTFDVAPQVTATGNTNTSTSITGVSSTVGLVVGMNIGGTGIPAGAKITAFDATTITISLAATSTAVGVALSAGYDNELSIGGNITNNGTFDMSRGEAVGVCYVNFTKAGDQTIGGTGTLTQFREVRLNKGSSANRVIGTSDVSMGGAGIVFNAGSWEQSAGRLTTTGTINIGSAATTNAFSLTGSGSARVLSSINVYGKLLVNTTDSLIVGSGTQKIDQTYVAGSSAVYAKGTVQIFGKFVMNALCSTAVSGANLIVDPKGFAAISGTDYAFRSTTGGGTQPFRFTDGTISIINPNSTPGANQELQLNSSVAPVITGNATFVLGQGASTEASTAGFRFSHHSAASFNHLKINTGAVGVTLMSNIVVRGTLTLTSSGALAANAVGLLWRAPRYVFDGTAAQVTGILMPDTAKVVVVNNALGVTSSQSLRISDTLYLVSGTLTGPYSAANTVSGSTGVDDGSVVPQGLVLHQNYPNPFNPSTSITFTLGHTANVMLSVYDMLGREVAMLVAGEREAGTHTVQWDATRHAGGMYYAVMRCGGTVETRKMVLLK